jgi:hypothetical protein
MKQPCSECPFRADVALHIPEPLLSNLSASVYQQKQRWHCHLADGTKPCIGSVRVIKDQGGESLLTESELVELRKE